MSNLGVVLVKLGRYDEAIAEYEAAEKMMPNDPRIGLNLALAYSKSGQVDGGGGQTGNAAQGQSGDSSSGRHPAAHGREPEGDRLAEAAGGSGDLAVSYMLGMACFERSAQPRDKSYSIAF